MCGYCFLNSESGLHEYNENGSDGLEITELSGTTDTSDSDLSGGALDSAETSDSITYNGGVDYIDALLNRYAGEQNNSFLTWTGEVSGGFETAAPTAGQAVTITYNINYEHQARYGGTTNLSASEETAVRAALDMWSNIANVTFVETEGAADIGFYKAGLPTYGSSYTAGIAHTSAWGNGHIEYSDVYVTNHSLTYGEGDNGWATVIHEIGHALGLKHPGDYNGNGTGTGPFLDADKDNTDFSIMAYDLGDPNDADTHTYGNGKDPWTPMLYDIAAIQYLYGANTSYNSGNTTYSLTGVQKFWAIWDGGGSDTLDASGVAGNHLLDIREGEYNESEVGSEVVWVGFGANIENATGGSGNDTIIGNAMDNILVGNGGADTLTGGAGADTLQGGSGNDQYTLATGDGTGNVIDDSGSGDTLVVNGNTLSGTATAQGGGVFNLTVNSVTHVLTQSGSDMVLTIQGNGSDSWTIKDFTTGDYGITTATPGQTITGTDEVAGNGWVKQNLYTGMQDFYVSDLDNDGTLEIVGQYADTTTWYHNPGAGWTKLYTTGGPDAFDGVNIDGDAPLEFYGMWSGTFWMRDIGSGWSRLTYGDGAEDFKMVDIDNDGTFEFVGDYGAAGMKIYDPDTMATTTKAAWGNPDDFDVFDYDQDGTFEFYGKFGNDIRMYDDDTGEWTEMDEFDGAGAFAVADENGDGLIDFYGTFTGPNGTFVWRIDGKVSGSDTLTGGAGNDTINGGTGNDYLTGSTGTDTFVFGNNFGNDTIYDFRSWEILDFNVDGITTANDLLSNTSYSGSGATITVDGHGSVFLAGVQNGDLDAANFDFS